MAVAVVTGGASGFGLALGRAAAEEGFDVVLLDRDGTRVAAESAAIGALGIGVDVADAAAVEAVAGEVRARLGGADLVVSNVGVQLFGPVERLTDDEWRWVLDVNVVGSARVARAFLPLLRASTAPRLAFTTSSSVLDPGSHMAAYQASKFAVWGLAETLALELAGEGIGVSVVFPSGMITRHLESSADAQPDEVRRPIGTDEDFTAMLASNPALAAAVADPAVIAPRVLAAVLAGERYVVTHGDLVEAVDARSSLLRAAAVSARSADVTGCGT